MLNGFGAGWGRDGPYCVEIGGMGTLKGEGRLP
jgi:hypothetical protein